MRPPRSLTVISLGGGVQSSVMALMAGEGAFDRVPDCAVFADTKWEPPSIYAHLEWLEGQLGFPLHVVDNGRSLREDVKALTNHSGSPRYIDIPVYLKGRDGQDDGIGRRQCTDSYKIRPIRRKVRELLGLKKRQRVPAGTAVELWLGISTDEAIRMKPSRDRWITNRYPLIEAGMSRRDCMDWWKERYDRPLERSACVACPFQSRSQVGRDQAPVAGAVRRGGGDRLEHARQAGLRQGALPSPPADAPRRGGHARRSGPWSRWAIGQVRQRVRGSLWRLRDRLDDVAQCGGTVYGRHVNCILP